MLPTLYFVVPCYKDVDVLPVTGPQFLNKLQTLIDSNRICDKSRVLFVNDGSSDGTWEVICSLYSDNAHTVGISLKKNVGEKYALLAGMDYAVECGADCVITADSDLQDDLDASEKMLELFSEGNDLVLGVRSERTCDPFRERFFSKCFYFIMWLLKTGLVTEHSNFRLMSAKAVRSLKAYENVPYFLPAMVCSLPFPRAVVRYKRLPRSIGKSGYNFIKKLRLAADAILIHSALLPKLFPFCIFLFSSLTVGFAWLTADSWPQKGRLPIFSLVFCVMCFLVDVYFMILVFLRKRLLRSPCLHHQIVNSTELMQSEPNKEEHAAE